MTQKTRNYLQPKKDFARALSVIYQTKLMPVLKKKSTGLGSFGSFCLVSLPD
jgi:hypothetical protein